MTPWKSDAAHAELLSWWDRFHARLPAGLESRRVSTRHGETHLLVGGPPDAPPLVVLHGALAGSAHALLELAPLLERHRVHALDVIGQSPKSAAARPSVSNGEYGEWLRDVLDALSLARPAVLGVSFGGFVATRLAALAPERVGSLVLLVPAGVVSGSAWEGMWKIGVPMTMYLLRPSEERLARFVEHLVTVPDELWVPYLGCAFRAYDLSMKIPRLARPEELAAVRAPVLVLGADQDVSFPGRKLLARAKELFPHAETELLEGCRHCPPTTDEFRGWLGRRVTTFLEAAGS